MTHSVPWAFPRGPLLHGSSRQSSERMITGLTRAPNVEATANYSKKIKETRGPMNTRAAGVAMALAAAAVRFRAAHAFAALATP